MTSSRAMATPTRSNAVVRGMAVAALLMLVAWNGVRITRDPFAEWGWGVWPALWDAVLDVAYGRFRSHDAMELLLLSSLATWTALCPALAGTVWFRIPTVIRVTAAFSAAMALVGGPLILAASAIGEPPEWRQLTALFWLWPASNLLGTLAAGLWAIDGWREGRARRA